MGLGQASFFIHATSDTFSTLYAKFFLVKIFASPPPPPEKYLYTPCYAGVWEPADIDVNEFMASQYVMFELLSVEVLFLTQGCSRTQYFRGAHAG